VDPKAITFVTADTGQSPNEGFTAGSATVNSSGLALMNAAAQTRRSWSTLPRRSSACRRTS